MTDWPIAYACWNAGIQVILIHRYVANAEPESASFGGVSHLVAHLAGRPIGSHPRTASNSAMPQPSTWS